jgi:hypothetical protein
MSKDDEIARKLQEQLDTEKPMTMEFTEPGPFELPKCGSKVGLVHHRDYVVLQLETEEHNQRLFVPISAQALPALRLLVNNAVDNHGVGQTRN